MSILASVAGIAGAVKAVFGVFGKVADMFSRRQVEKQRVKERDEQRRVGGLEASHKIQSETEEKVHEAISKSKHSSNDASIDALRRGVRDDKG